MRNRKWLITLSVITILNLFTLVYAYIEQGDFLINFVNASFMIGLFFLVISGSSYVIIGGFFKVSLMGWKRLLKRNNDDSIDRTHWSYENNEYEDEDVNEDDKHSTSDLRKKAKNDLFITLPLIIGIVLIAESLTFTNIFIK